MRVRKNWLALTTAERDTYLQAVLTLKNTVANPGAPVAQRYSTYDQFVLIHQALAGGQTPFSGETVDLGHQGWHFLPWHRKFLIELEDALNVAVPGQNIAIPYWDWPPGLRWEPPPAASIRRRSPSASRPRGRRAGRPRPARSRRYRPMW